MVIMNDLEWPMLSYYVIYYKKFRKVMKRIEKVALNLKISCKDVDRVKCVLKVWFTECATLF